MCPNTTPRLWSLFDFVKDGTSIVSGQKAGVGNPSRFSISARSGSRTPNGTPLPLCLDSVAKLGTFVEPPGAGVSGKPMACQARHKGGDMSVHAATPENSWRDILAAFPPCSSAGQATQLHSGWVWSERKDGGAAPPPTHTSLRLHHRLPRKTGHESVSAWCGHGAGAESERLSPLHLVLQLHADREARRLASIAQLVHGGRNVAVVLGRRCHELGRFVDGSRGSGHREARGCGQPCIVH